MQSIVKTRCVSALILAILLASSMLAFVPVSAAAAAVTVSLDYTYIKIGDYEGTPKRTVSVANPLGNPGITRIEIQVPAAAAEATPAGTFAAGFVSTGAVSVAGIGPWVITYPGSPAGVVILPGGATGKLTVSIDPKDSTATSGVADVHTLTVTIFFEGGETQVQTLTIYEGDAATTLVVVTTTGTLKAGQSIAIKVTLNAITKGISLTLKRVTPSLPSGFTDSFTPSKVETGTSADPAATATYMSTYANKTALEGYTLKAIAGTLDATYSNNLGVLTENTCTAFGIVTEVPSKVTVGTEMDNDAVTSYITKQPINVWAGLSDKYGNLVAVDQNVNVTFTATAGTLSPTKALILNGASKSANVSYTCVSTYGSYAMITGALTLPSGSKWAGTYSGNSRQLATSTFAATILVATDKTSVKAGTQATITLTLAVVQKNVPVTFAISDATTGYTGTLTVLSAVTDDTGKATTKLNVDVISGRKAKVKATVSRPLSTKITNTIENKTAEITTIAADPAKLIVKTYEHGTTTARSITTPGGVLDVVVSLADAYDNVASNTFAGDIQVGLSATAGALSVTTAYIKKDAFDTSTWGTILFTAPSVTGTVTITATTTQANVAQGSTTVTVAGPEPVVTITDPATDTEIASDVAVTRYIAGNVQVSPAQPSGTAISLIKYSLDGAANVTTPITKVEAGKYYFNFSVSLTPNATHTVIVYATDTAGKTGLATRVIKIVPYLPPGTGTFTPSAPKLLDSAGAVVTSVARNTAFYVQITLKSNSASNLSPYVLAQIKDATGRVVAIGLSQPDVAAGATKNVAVPFLGIATPGTYTVTIFVWSSITDPVAWAPTTTFTIVVT